MSYEKIVAICGLNCRECQQYPELCGGCLSDRLSKDCQECQLGFRVCAEEHQVVRCNECTDFPCERTRELEAIQKDYGFNDNVIENLHELNNE